MIREFGIKQLRNSLISGFRQENEQETLLAECNLSIISLLVQTTNTDLFFKEYKNVGSCHSHRNTGANAR